jgi:FkbM family methyltransferase
MSGEFWVEVNYQGRRYRLATHGEHDQINKSLSRGHFYEADLLTVIAAIGRTGVYLDVGTHIGNHTLFFATECPSTAVIGFEPWEPSYRLAVRTMKANNVLDKVYIINCPVSSADGEMVSFFPPNRSLNTGAGYCIKGGHVKSVSVDGTVSRLVKNSPVALIKIDVEGFDLEVLHGASRTIGNWRPYLVVEAQNNAIHQIINAFLTTQHDYDWVGRYCATPTHLYTPYPAHK